MALADIQSLWTSKLKPWINGRLTPMQAEIDALETGADIQGIFAMTVDMETMHLKATSYSGGTFSVVNGHLMLEQQ